MPVSVMTAQIIRQTCLALEVTSPTSLEDGSDLASDLLAFYPEARDRCLEACDWSFASTLRALPELTSLPVGFVADIDLPYAYAYPSDARKILEVENGTVAWRRDAECIRADQPAPLRVRYTASSPAETTWPAEFRAAVALTLASMLAPKFKPGASLIEQLERRAANAIKQAMRNHASDASPARYDGGPEEGDWATEARY